VMQLEGVQGVQETHFWTLCSNYYCGGLKLEVSANADAKYIVSHTQMIFRGINVTQLYVHLDFIEAGAQTYSNNQAQHAGQNLLLQNPGGYGGGYGGLDQAPAYDSGGHGHAHDHSGHGHSHDNHAYVR